MKYCGKCGRALAPTAEFCGYCGTQTPNGKSTHRKHIWISVAVGLTLLFSVVCLVSFHIARQNNHAEFTAQVSGKTEAASQSGVAISTESANADTESKTEYLQASPAMICIYDDDELRNVIRFTYDSNHLITECSEEGFTDGETTWTQQVSMTYDNQDRLIRQDIMRSDLTFTDGGSGYRIYRYDSAGNLIYKESITFEGWFKITYSYDSESRLLHSTGEYEPYTVTTDYIYDSSGNVERRENRYDDGYGSTWSETLYGDSDEMICTDYKPFELTFYKNTLDTIRISIVDKEGQAVWTTLLSTPVFQTDEHGYLTEIQDKVFGGTIRTYQIHYNGKTS